MVRDDIVPEQVMVASAHLACEPVGRPFIDGLALVEKLMNWMNHSRSSGTTMWQWPRYGCEPLRPAAHKRAENRPHDPGACNEYGPEMGER